MTLARVPHNDPNGYVQNAQTNDVIFAESSFDASGLDLEGLDALLANLLALHVGSDGNLVD
jgi:hypothetical protein